MPDEGQSGGGNSQQQSSDESGSRTRPAQRSETNRPIRKGAVSPAIRRGARTRPKGAPAAAVSRSHQVPAAAAENNPATGSPGQGKSQSQSGQGKSDQSQSGQGKSGSNQSGTPSPAKINRVRPIGTEPIRPRGWQIGTPESSDRTSQTRAAENRANCNRAKRNQVNHSPAAASETARPRIQSAGKCRRCWASQTAGGRCSAERSGQRIRRKESAVGGKKTDSRQGGPGRQRTARTARRRQFGSKPHGRRASCQKGEGGEKQAGQGSRFARFTRQGRPAEARRRRTEIGTRRRRSRKHQGLGRQRPVQERRSRHHFAARCQSGSRQAAGRIADARRIKEPEGFVRRQFAQP